MTYYGTAETRIYDTMGRLTSLTSGSSVNVRYNYPAPGSGMNVGKACLVTDVASGEQVVYV